MNYQRRGAVTSVPRNFYPRGAISLNCGPNQTVRINSNGRSECVDFNHDEFFQSNYSPKYSSTNNNNNSRTRFGAITPKKITNRYNNNALVDEIWNPIDENEEAEYYPIDSDLSYESYNEDDDENEDQDEKNQYEKDKYENDQYKYNNYTYGRGPFQSPLRFVNPPIDSSSTKLYGRGPFQSPLRGNFISKNKNNSKSSSRNSKDFFNQPMYGRGEFQSPLRSHRSKSRRY